ncbi:hypothetical protein IW492_14560 [Enterococcus sp. BWB1-3]|uniref:Lin0368 family putative glycerol transporter subunit n=1 Tax=unclassified Enterococcus TaxID=2608891 RepID=UPI001924D1D6|nr:MULTISPECIES: hypothetical protein [unclassified Enterococcus]MBL1230452.1 hypothetical protein [Enterococcus sp. BWB1-3]MCB5950831.1 hypothetical protein [Enterococcus sp. BWT-B8]MCB5955271.1 hypothetical protein [Enterococcus sp. CWB-B31]
MKFLRSIVGYMIAGIIVMAVWGELGSFGIFGGYLAAGIIIGPMWFMNHYLNLTGNEEDAAFVDMGLAIAICGLARDTFMHGGSALSASIPTIALVAGGAAFGGLAAAVFEKSMSVEKAAEEQAPEPGMTEKELKKLAIEE